MEGNKLCVLVSVCLLGENCKFNGGNNDNQAVKNFLTNKQAVPICPELLAGLPTPRPPAEIVNGRVTKVAGQDGQFVGRKISGSGLFAQTLRENGYRVIDAEDIK